MSTRKTTKPPTQRQAGASGTGIEVTALPPGEPGEPGDDGPAGLAHRHKRRRVVRIQLVIDIDVHVGRTILIGEDKVGP